MSGLVLNVISNWPDVGEKEQQKNCWTLVEMLTTTALKNYQNIWHLMQITLIYLVLVAHFNFVEYSCDWLLWSFQSSPTYWFNHYFYLNNESTNNFVVHQVLLPWNGTNLLQFELCWSKSSFWRYENVSRQKNHAIRVILKHERWNLRCFTLSTSLAMKPKAAKTFSWGTLMRAVG